MFKLQCMIEKLRPDLLTLSTTFFGLSVSAPTHLILSGTDGLSLINPFLDINLNNNRKGPKLSGPFVCVAIGNDLVLKVNYFVSLLGFGKTGVVVPVAEDIFLEVQNRRNQTPVQNRFNRFSVDFDLERIRVTQSWVKFDTLIFH